MVGFKRETKRVGELNNYKDISELLCIVPILKNGNSYIMIDESYEIQAENLKFAQKYMLPPILGYNNPNLKNDSKLFFAVEIKDFWSKRDLAYIWQNLLPQNGLNHKEVNNIYELKDQKVLELLKDQDVYFHIFKCKLRSKTNSYEFPNDPKIGYNWPYDYFSLLELCKIDIITEEIVVDKDNILLSCESLLDFGSYTWLYNLSWPTFFSLSNFGLKLYAYVLLDGGILVCCCYTTSQNVPTPCARCRYHITKLSNCTKS
jgi:hypothetical protein